MTNTELKNIKIIILINSLGYGGLERIAATVINKLSEKYSIYLAVGRKVRSIEYPVNISKHYFFNDHPIKYYSILIIPMQIIKYIFRVYRYRPSLSLSFSPLDNIVNMFISYIFKIPIIISAHGMWQHSKRKGLGRYLSITYLESLLLKSTDSKVIAVSNGVKRSMVENFGIPENKIHVIYNPIDIVSIQQLSKEAISQNLSTTDVPTIITVGRLSTEKAQWHIIRAFAMLRRNRPARLLICGVGPEETYLKTLVNELDIGMDVLFLGWQVNPYKYMKNSTVFVLSSLSEGLPNVLTEAMASGCPVISANCSPGVREIIGEHNEYGFLAKKMTGIRHAANDPLDSGEKSLLALMYDVINNNDLQAKYIKQGIKRAEFFSVDWRIKEYGEFIQECIFESAPTLGWHR